MFATFHVSRASSTSNVWFEKLHSFIWPEWLQKNADFFLLVETQFDLNTANTQHTASNTSWEALNETKGLNAYTVLELNISGTKIF